MFARIDRERDRCTQHSGALGGIAAEIVFA
jgi:hypothetical protein